MIDKIIFGNCSKIPHLVETKNLFLQKLQTWNWTINIIKRLKWTRYIKYQSGIKLRYNNWLVVYLHELRAPKCAKSIQYVVEKNIQPWISCRDSSFLSSWNQRRPAKIPKPIVCTQLSLDNILGLASWKFLCDNTLNCVQKLVGQVK